MPRYHALTTGFYLPSWTTTTTLEHPLYCRYLYVKLRDLVILEDVLYPEMGWKGLIVPVN